MTASPRVILKRLGVSWGVSYCTSGHSMGQAARVALIFGLTSFIASIYATGGYTMTLPVSLSTPLPGYTYCGGVVLSTGSCYIPDYNVCQPILGPVFTWQPWVQ